MASAGGAVGDAAWAEARFADLDKPRHKDVQRDTERTKSETQKAQVPGKEKEIRTHVVGVTYCSGIWVMSAVWRADAFSWMAANVKRKRWP